MATKILGVYKISYDNGATQIKNMISHDDFVNVYKVAQERIYELEKANKFKETASSKQLKKEMKYFFGPEWFTDKSPLFDAYKTGKMYLSPWQGGEINCKVEQLNIV